MNGKQELLSGLSGDLYCVVWPWLDTPHLGLGEVGRRCSLPFVRDKKLPGGRSAASLCASLAPPTQPLPCGCIAAESPDPQATFLHVITSGCGRSCPSCSKAAVTAGLGLVLESLDVLQPEAGRDSTSA